MKGHAALSWGVEGEVRGLVFGVDEVGRGPLAGPVMAAAACLSADSVPWGLRDSKQLSPAARQRIAAELDRAGAAAVAEASVAEIDRLNILWATMLAMERAVAALAARLGPPALVLVDGNRLPDWAWRARAIVGGDRSVAAIAAASVAAKVARDQRMVQLAGEFPGYDWAANKGYPTAGHLRALHTLGPTPHHRQSFAPVRAASAAGEKSASEKSGG